MARLAAPLAASAFRRRAAVVWPYASIAAIALLIRGSALGQHDLWYDEAFSALVSFGTMRDIVREMAVDSSPPLYFLSLHLWRGVFGPSPEALRSFSVLMGVLAVPLTGLLARRLWGRPTDLLAMGLVAVSPLHVYFSREVRPYPLLVVLALLSILGLERVADKQRTVDLLAYSLVTLAACYSHNYGLLLLGFPILGALEGRLPWKTAAAGVVIVLAGYAAWVPILIAQITSGATQWIARWWEATPPPAALLKTFAVYSFGGQAPAYLALGQERLPDSIDVFAYIVFGIVFAAAFLLRPREAAGRVALRMAILLAVPAVVSVVTPIYLVGRHDVIALPLFLILGARGIERLGRSWGVLCLAVALTLAVVSLSAYYTVQPRRESSRRASVLALGAGANDVVVCTGFTRNGLEYYTRLDGGTTRFMSFPSSSGEHRGWVDERSLQNAARVQQDAAILVAGVLGRLRAEDRVWIAHARELASANDVLMREVERRMRQVPCRGKGEDAGFTCWRAPS